MAADSSDPPTVRRDLSAWLETVAVSAEAVNAAPRSTIIPQRSSVGAEQAAAMLERLSGLGTSQLQPGEVIAEGGMGIIRAAEQVALGRVVAVKTLKHGSRDPRATLDLLREAWVTGSVEHPNVVPVHHLGIDADGTPLLVMRRVDGVAWSALIADAAAVGRRFGATDLLAWNLGVLMQVLNAVRFAHSRGIVHRDLKPSNVMIGEFGEVYLLDWGLAVSLRDDGTGRLLLARDATDLAGTPAYMAPEMLGREDGVALSERTDVYLAGAVLFEIVAGRPPHFADTMLGVLNNVMASTPAFPAHAPGELAKICAQAMREDPGERFASAEAMRLALQAYLEHRGSARLTDLAGERLEQLLAALAPATGEPVRTREEIYRLFGACRFGFHEALVAWRDNADARAGLVRATIALAEHELAHGDPHAAVGALSELDDAPAELLARARAAVGAADQRRDELEQLQRRHDPQVRIGPRILFIGLLGTLFTAACLALAVFPDWRPLARPEFVPIASGGLVVVVVLYGWIFREAIVATVINLRAWGVSVALFVAQGVMGLAMWSLGVSAVTTQVIAILLWAMTAGLSAITIDRRLAVSAAAFTIAFVVAAHWPAHRFWAAAAANAVFAGATVWLSWPRPAAATPPT